MIQENEVITVMLIMWQIKKVKKIFEALTRSNEPELERDD